MAAPKYNAYVNGKFKQITAAVVGGGGSIDMIPALNGAGQFDATMLPSAPTTTALASELIAAGSLVNIWNDTGVSKVRNADNTGAASSKSADGFAPTQILSGAVGTVVLSDGIVGGLALTEGNDYYLGVAGAVIDNPPTATGECSQAVGKALTATTLAFHAGMPVELA